MAYNFDVTIHPNKYWTVEIDTAAKYGYFEHNENGTGGGLWFEVAEGSTEGDAGRKLKLIDYDGMPCLPKSMVAALREAGYLLDETFD